MRPPACLLPLTCGLALAGVVLAASAVPAWRHQHVGATGHTHGHAHPHPPDGSASGHRDGWHLHLAGFGIEITLWEPGFLAAAELDAEHETDPEREPPTERPPAGGATVRLMSSPAVASWAALLWLDAGPPPDRVMVPAVSVAGRCAQTAIPWSSRAADAPPVPPLETV